MNISSSFFNYPTEALDNDIEELIFLTHWGNNDWTKLFALSQTYRFGTGDIAIRQGESERAFYLVAFGQFEILLPTANRRDPRRLSVAEMGSILGEQTFLDGKPSDVDIVATTGGELVRISYDAFEIFAAREPELARDILMDLARILSLRLRQTTAMLSR